MKIEFFSHSWGPSNPHKLANSKVALIGKRIDWNLIKKAIFGFIPNQIFSHWLIHYFFMILDLNPSTIYTQCIHMTQGRNSCLKNPIPNSKKPWVTRHLQPYFCFNSIDSKPANRFLEVLGIIPDVHRSKIHPETRYHDFGLDSLFPNSILIIHV